jgi:hypothetical protein
MGLVMESTGLKANVQASHRSSTLRSSTNIASSVYACVCAVSPSLNYNLSKKAGRLQTVFFGREALILRIREVVYLAWLIPTKSFVRIKHPQPTVNLLHWQNGTLNGAASTCGIILTRRGNSKRSDLGFSNGKARNEQHGRLLR